MCHSAGDSDESRRTARACARRCAAQEKCSTARSPAGLAHLGGAAGSASSALTARGEVGDEPVRVERRAGAVAACSIGTSSPVSPSATTSGMPPVAVATTARLAGHRLQVDDAHRLVDRRADEHRGVREHLDRPRAWAASPRPRSTPSRSSPQLVDQRRRPRRRSRGCPARRRSSTSCASAGSVAGRPQQVGQPLLPGDPADEDHARAGPGRCRAASSTSVPGPGAYSSVSMPLWTTWTRSGVDRRVGGEHVAAHARRETAMTASAASQRGPLGPGGERVAAAELLGLPRPQRLQAVRGHHVRHAVQQLGDVPGEVGVPGVAVHEVGARARRRPSPGRRRACAAPALAPASPAGSRYAVTPGSVARRRRSSAPGRRRARRSSRARYSTCTPAPPYTSGGYSRVSRSTRMHVGSVVRPALARVRLCAARCAGRLASRHGGAEGPRDRPGRWRGQAADAAHRGPGQAGRAVRRHLPAWSTSCCPTWPTAATCKIVVLTQYKSHSLDRHITKTWRMSTLLGNYVTPVPAQQRLGPALVRRLGRRDPTRAST